MMCICFPLSLREVQDLFFGRGIDICDELVRFTREFDIANQKEAKALLGKPT